MSFHTASMISSPQQQPGSQRIQKFSKQAGMEKKFMQNLHWIQQTQEKTKRKKKLRRRISHLEMAFQVV